MCTCGNPECMCVTESKYSEDDIFEVEDKSSKTSKFLILETFKLYGMHRTHLHKCRIAIAKIAGLPTCTKYTTKVL